MKELEIDFSDIEAKYKIEVPTKFDHVLMIDNVPIVDSKKQEKLLSVIKKIFKNIAKIQEEGIYMPTDEDGKSKGFLFIQFANAKEAKLALQQDGYKLDKNHTLSITPFDEIEDYINMDEEYVEPEVVKYTPKEHTKYWLGDERARDQYAMIKGDEVEIHWNNKQDMPDKIQSRQNWSDSYIAWSPLGSYLLTVHRQGVTLWGGPSWQRINRFAHPNVSLIDFSPNEKYIVTWSQEPFKSLEGQMHNICVWDTLTATMLRSFASPSVQANDSSAWPFLKWSHDEEYVARMTPGEKGVIYVYESATMGLLGKKSIKVENLKDICWSPSDNILTYWTPEVGNIPARVTMLNIPDKSIVRTKNFFNVIDCKLYWQPAGDYFLVKIDRTKTKTTTITSFEVFRMREKDIPVDVVELKVSEDMQNVFWEPKGNRFALLINDNNVPFVYFYEVQRANALLVSSASCKVLKHFEAKGINQVIWSPKGRFCVLGGISGLSGDLQFWDVQELTLLATAEHYSCTDVEWDPTGRYVVTSVSSLRVRNDAGFVIWTLTGQELLKQNIANFKQFSWRPRPKTLLSEDEQSNIKKNLKEYSREFDEEDARETNKASFEVKQKRLELWQEYKTLLKEFKETAIAERKERIAIFGFDPQDVEETHNLQDTFEELIEVVEEFVD